MVEDVARCVTGEHNIFDNIICLYETEIGSAIKIKMTTQVL